MPRKTPNTPTDQPERPLIARDNWTLPPLDDPALAHIEPDLRALAVPVATLVKLPGNYHQGDVGVVSASLGRFNQRKPIVVNARTGHIEAGNTTFDGTVANQREWVAAVLVEDDEAMEKAYAVVDNRAQELGWNDPAALSAMLLEVREFDDALFEVTGYDGDDLDDLLKEVGALGGTLDPDPERWDGINRGTAGSDDAFGTLRPGMTPGERADAYEAASVRSLVLTYDMAQYVWVTEHLAHLRRELEVDNNADVFLHLVAERRGSRFPTTTVTTIVEHDAEDAELEPAAD